MIDVMILVFYVALGAVVISLYEGKTLDYKSGREPQPDSVSSFKTFYLYLHVATPVIVIASCLGYDKFFVIEPGTVLRLAGASLSALGVAIFAGAKMKIGSDFSPCNDAYLPRDVVRDGIYRFIRHPIYAAFILFFLGVSVATMNIIAALNWVVLVAYYVRSVSLEEKALLIKFPETYAAYRESTGRFIPRIIPGGRQ